MCFWAPDDKDYSNISGPLSMKTPICEPAEVAMGVSVAHEIQAKNVFERILRQTCHVISQP